MTTTPTAPNIPIDDRWGVVAAEMDRVETKGAWEGTANSFTDWLRIKSDQTGVSESTLWRYLGAGRSYQKMAAILNAHGLAAPSLKAVSATVSPESLEILAKISRVAPEPIFLDMAAKLIDGSVSRATLRRTWSAYRPVLEGKTARGGGASAPRVDKNAPEIEEGVLLAVVKAALSERLGLLTDSFGGRPAIFLTEVSPQPSSVGASSLTFDAVTACRSDSNGKLIVHGIEIVERRVTQLIRKLEKLAPFCDRLWIAIHEDNLPPPSGFPVFVGILLVDANGGLSALRRAESSELLGHRSGELARGMILKQVT